MTYLIWHNYIHLLNGDKINEFLSQEIVMIKGASVYKMFSIMLMTSRKPDLLWLCSYDVGKRKYQKIFFSLLAFCSAGEDYFILKYQACLFKMVAFWGQGQFFALVLLVWTKEWNFKDLARLQRHFNFIYLSGRIPLTSFPLWFYLKEPEELIEVDASVLVIKIRYFLCMKCTFICFLFSISANKVL